MAGQEQPQPPAVALVRDDREEELVYEIEVRMKIKSGTLPALVENLTHPDKLDAAFNETYLLCYSTFATAEEFFDALITRFRSRRLSTQASLQPDAREKQGTIRVRVINILKNWLEWYWAEPNNSESTEFLRRAFTLVKDSPEVMATPGAQQLLAVIEQRMKGQEIKRLVPQPSATSPPSPIIPRSMKKLKLLDVDPLETARQLTMIESSLFCRIRHYELLNKTWQKKPEGSSAPRTAVNAMILHSNQLANWVGEFILWQPNMKKRVAMMKYFVTVAEKCREFNNFASLMSIISGLGTTPVYRLHLTWSQVSRRSLTALEEMRDLMGSSKNFSKYRETVKTSNPPCIPFIGVYLTDLTFIDDGIPNFTSPDMINFAKRAKVVEILREIQHFQSSPHNFQPVPDLQEIITKNLKSATEIQDMYDRSLELEPRRQDEENMPGVDRYAATGSHMSSVVIASMLMR